MSRATLRMAAALIALTALANGYQLIRCGGGLSTVGDAYSEANALRAGERYARDGYLADCGLPYVSYGSRFPAWGITGEAGRVYHGYPPGPDWLAGVYTRLLGPERFPLFRLAPVTIGVACSAVFLLGLIRAVGPGRGLAVYLACLLTPMFTNMTHSLHCHGYVFSLLLLELGLLLIVFSRPGPLGPGWPASMFALGFLQGWLSFDYCFLVTFASVPVAFLATPRGARPSSRAVAALVLATGIGFTLAHVLHFLQTVAYFGGLRGALDEYASRASNRYALSGTALDGLGWPYLVGHGLRKMAESYLRWTHLFSPISLVLGGLTVAVLVLSRASGTVSHRIRVDAHFAPRLSDAVGALIGLGVGLAWLLAKPYHAINHMSFIGRHLFLFYLGCGLLVAKATTLRIGWRDGARSRWWPSRDVFRRRRASRAAEAVVRNGVAPERALSNGQHTVEEDAEAAGPSRPR